MTFTPIPYADRAIRPRGTIRREGWALKRYDITLNTGAVDEPICDEGLEQALSSLPMPPMTGARPGVGFVICHQGRDVHYIVLNWWDNENELFQRVFIRGFEPGAAWRDGAGSGSFCVWDAQVIAFERDAYVTHVLTASPDLTSYVDASMST